MQVETLQKAGFTVRISANTGEKTRWRNLAV
jgi:hypothetical protein